MMASAAIAVPSPGLLLPLPRNGRHVPISSVWWNARSDGGGRTACRRKRRCVGAFQASKPGCWVVGCGREGQQQSGGCVAPWAVEGTWSRRARSHLRYPHGMLCSPAASVGSHDWLSKCIGDRVKRGGRGGPRVAFSREAELLSRREWLPGLSTWHHRGRIGLSWVDVRRRTEKQWTWIGMREDGRRGGQKQTTRSAWPGGRDASRRGRRRRPTEGGERDGNGNRRERKTTGDYRGQSRASYEDDEERDGGYNPYYGDDNDGDDGDNDDNKGAFGGFWKGFWRGSSGSSSSGRRRDGFDRGRGRRGDADDAQPDDFPRVEDLLNDELMRQGDLLFAELKDDNEEEEEAEEGEEEEEEELEEERGRKKGRDDGDESSFDLFRSPERGNRFGAKPFGGDVADMAAGNDGDGGDWEDWLDDRWREDGKGTYGSEADKVLGGSGGWYVKNSDWEKDGMPRGPPKVPERGMRRTIIELIKESWRPEEEVLDELAFEARVFEFTSRETAKFVAVLILVPWLMGYLMHDYVLMPFLGRYVEEVPLIAQVLDVREKQKLKMIEELKLERQRIRFYTEVGNAPPLSDFEMSHLIREKVIEMRDEVRLENRAAFANIFSDSFSGLVLVLLLFYNPKYVSIVRLTGQRFFTNISDTGKAFLIILFSDIFLGYHSESGWETVVELFLEHYGWEMDQGSIYLFIAVVPVTMDACFKLWVFRFLGRLSPSAAATLRTMNRH